MEKGRVLVMDDEEVVRELTGAMLKNAGYDVELAINSNEAAHLYKKALTEANAFDVVILDLSVPEGLGGETAVRELRSIDPHVKAIVSSGYSNNPVMEHCEEYGFRAVLFKPFKMDTLLKTVQNVIKSCM